MQTPAMDWIEAMPALRGMDPSAKALLKASATRILLPPGATAFRPGDTAAQFPLVVSGSIRVQKITCTGREIVLYRVSAHETCILSIAGLLTGEEYTAEAIAETEVVAYALRPSAFERMMGESAQFRAFVFSGYSQRIATLMARIEDIVCTRIDVRLAERLLAILKSEGHIETTQHALAADLGTAREVVGRALRNFERAGWVSLSRGAVEIVDATALKALLADRD
ncbi:Crp/Fnr family transcriptional regulator [Methylocystis bryophila]|uniref:Crp/Fnr family transcriptional regulator n=1 Tax=Methylocystis bryophila TaxID=655015 RepID=A0A1W6MZU6_9HYPH|nr:Crp/Fnr family transcriptional regulator [Methylocystis bryophila]ARN83076.1 Crp/Fnr family transcriptional regulator [Methylocystis bryophila]BDV39389.1 Crp/Fnr family transcriptional regulator [Methylocystis bryophila]